MHVRLSAWVLTAAAGIGLPQPFGLALRAQAPAQTRGAVPQGGVANPRTERPAPAAVASAAAARSVVERAELLKILEKQSCSPPQVVMRVTQALDPTPLQRPVLVATVTGTRPDALNRIGALVRQSGFRELSRNLELAELRAVRTDAVEPRARDEVLVWLEGQIGDATRVRVYLLYGRYEPWFGHPDAQRVRAAPDQVERQIGNLMRSITALAASA